MAIGCVRTGQRWGPTTDRRGDGVGLVGCFGYCPRPDRSVFTRDEETGLSGAFGMKPGFMSGDILLNLDSEDEGQLFVSCAGERQLRLNSTLSRWMFRRIIFSSK